MKTVAVSGYFNPLHIGHLQMFIKAREYGDRLVAIVNSDEQVKLKGSVPFMSEGERLRIIDHIDVVDSAVLSIDTDKTVCRTLEIIQPDVFANGGDRKDVPERVVCERLGIELVFGVEGDANTKSSSTLIENACKFKNML